MARRRTRLSHGTQLKERSLRTIIFPKRTVVCLKRKEPAWTRGTRELASARTPSALLHTLERTEKALIPGKIDSGG